MSNLTFDNFQAIDESMDNIYEWSVDDTKLPFYVYQQYTFDIGAITFAVRFTRTFVVGIKSMRTSYVMIGKKMNKKISTKMPPLPNPKKFIATITDIIKHHLETFPKANRGIILRFDEKTFERVEKLFHLIVRLKLKTAYKYSEDFTWSPLEGSRCFYVWKKQFTFKSLYDNFLKAAAKEIADQQKSLVSGDLVDDNEFDIYTKLATGAEKYNPPVAGGNPFASTATAMKKTLKDIIHPDWGYPEDESGGDEDDEPLMKVTVVDLGDYTEKQLNDAANSIQLNEALLVGEALGEVWRFSYIEDDIYFLYKYNYLTNETNRLSLTKHELGATVLRAKEQYNVKSIDMASNDYCYIGFYFNETEINKKIFKIYFPKQNFVIRYNIYVGQLYAGDASDFKRIVSATGNHVWFPVPRRMLANNSDNKNIFFTDVYQKTNLDLHKVESKFSLPEPSKDIIKRILFSTHENLYIGSVLKLNTVEYKKPAIIDEIVPVMPLSELSKKRFEVSGEHTDFTKTNHDFSYTVGPFELKYTDDLAALVKKLKQLQDYVKDSKIRINIKQNISEELYADFMISVGEYTNFAHDIFKTHGISGSTQDAIKSYTGSTYQSVNKVLRGIGEVDDKAYTMDVIKALDTAFKTDAVYLSGFKIPVFRGQSVAEEDVDTIVKSGKYKTNSYYSTSTNIGTAYIFLKYESSLSDEGKLYSGLKLPRKGRIANLMTIKDIHRIPVLVPGEHSSFKSENEVILPRGTVMKLMNWEMIEREQIDSDKPKKLFVTTYSCLGVGDEMSQITEQTKHRLIEMIESDQESENIAKHLLVLDTLLDITEIGAIFPGVSNETLVDTIIKWSSND